MNRYILLFVITAITFFSCQERTKVNNDYLREQDQTKKYYSYVDFSPDLKNDLQSLGFLLPSQEIEAPVFTLKNLAGKQVSLETFRGNMVFLNFWGTWCYWCKIEMPSMQKLYDELKSDGFEIVAVNVNDSEQTARSYIAENNFTFPVLLDTNQTATRIYGIRGFPTTFLIDRKGNFIAKFVGSREWDDDNVIAVFRELLSAEY